MNKDLFTYNIKYCIGLLFLDTVRVSETHFCTYS